MTRIRNGRFLVTGGAGFIGSHLVDALLAKGAARVAVVDNFFLGKDKNLEGARSSHEGRLKIYRDDASNFHVMGAVCNDEKPDIVFNLATKALAYSFFNPVGAFDVNPQLALTCLELQRKGAFGKLVHLSSSEVYGTAQTVPMTESHPLLAETTYAAGKAAADLALMSFVRMFGADATIVRPFNNYGPRQNDQAFAAVIPLTVRRILRGEPPVLEGDGEQTRDFIYVFDTVGALLRVVEHDLPKGDVVNLGSGRETTIRSIVDGICEIMEYRGPVTHTPTRPADVRRHCASVAKAESLIGPIARTSLQDGLAATIDWYRTEADRRTAKP
ncbi:MAG: GDP-mannose 4,6-dehydratase [Polyangiaceae bacterium]|nr:GDP-mannose 4,6-dehydratase [Polyangiaceae bacterium]